MNSFETVALAIWRQCLPKMPDLQWEDLAPTEQRVALSMAHAAVMQVGELIRGARNPGKSLADLADKSATGLVA